MRGSRVRALAAGLIAAGGCLSAVLAHVLTGLTSDYRHVLVLPLLVAGILLLLGTTFAVVMHGLCQRDRTLLVRAAARDFGGIPAAWRVALTAILTIAIFAVAEYLEQSVALGGPVAIAHFVLPLSSSSLLLFGSASYAVMIAIHAIVYTCLLSAVAVCELVSRFKTRRESGRARARNSELTHVHHQCFVWRNVAERGPPLQLRFSL